MKRREFIQAAISSTALTGCSFGRHNHRNNAPKKVFEPLKIKNVTIPNRIVFPAINTNYADSKGFVTQRLIDFYKHVAEGGVGLTIVAPSTIVGKYGSGATNMEKINDKKYIEGLRQLFESIKQNGSIAGIQLVHFGRQGIPNEPSVAPSPIPCPGRKKIPKELSIEEIQELEVCFAGEAYIVKTAGADMIELHGGHGYLINEFLSPYSNKRSDEYGGNIENRTRFVREILEKTRKKVGENYPLGCRISADEFVDGGLTIEESKDIAQILVNSGIDVISVSVGTCGSRYSAIPTKEQGRRCYAYLARGIKDAVDVPVIGVGNILDLNDAEMVLENGDMDLAAMGRATIADPYLVSKTKKGKVEEINYCTQCRECLWWKSEPYLLSCSVNENL